MIMIHLLTSFNALALPLHAALHTPSQCQGKSFWFTKAKENELRQKKSKGNSDSTSQRTLHLNKALRAAEAVAEHDKDASESTESE